MVNIGFMACFDREHFPNFEKFAFESDQTLLEYDIVLWDMAFLHFGYDLEHGNRVRELKRLLRDRRRRLNEIEALMKNGKSLVILSPDPDAFYFETEKDLLRSDADSEIERTLQSEKITRNCIDIYSFLPPDIEERVRENAVVARGKKMDFSGDAAFTEAWKILKDMAWYNSYFLKPIGTPFLYVKGTQYPVASWLRYSNGNIFFVPGTEYDDSSDYPVFVEAAKILVNAVDRLSGNTVDLFWPDNDFGVPQPTASRTLLTGHNEIAVGIPRTAPITFQTPDLEFLGAHPPVEIQESLARFKEEHPEPSKVAFIMMQFGKTPAHADIAEAIKSALKPHGITGLRADDRQYHDDLFPNVLTYIYGCGFGIAVFERLETEQFNPNVALEVGYMFGLRKPVCLLKDRTLKILHADLVGKLYKEFDPQNPTGTIPKVVSEWLSDKELVSAREPSLSLPKQLF